ncbi:MAG TPA: biotin--[acetyl-CoA-carboxylase] ligase [Gemmatimonadales bacterium]|nr:biotin--[acetyl-CoA-carboxylase] ligase [Gemmatimonadales bacterium]
MTGTGVTLDGLPGAVLARRWGVPRCRLAREVGSALDTAHSLGQEGAPAGTVVMADVQTAGRGRNGRTWYSPPGGIWLALLLRPHTAGLGVMSIRAGLVVADVVDELLGASLARIKWPNDVLLNDRKLAGVLCEGRWQGDTLLWLAVGIGVNVTNEIAPELRGNAIALHELLPGVRRLDVLDRLVPPLARLGAGGERLSEAETAAFAARDWLRDRMLRAPAAGRAAGLQADGSLLVEGADGVLALRDGHVETV